MKNCIETVYPFSMENENAPIFGRLNVHMYDNVTITSNDQLTLIIRGKGVKVSVDGPAYFVVGRDTDPSVIENRHTEYVLPDNNTVLLVFSQGNYDIHIDEKYNLLLLGVITGTSANMSAIGMNLDDAAYLTNLKGLRWIYNNNLTSGSINSLGRLIHIGEDYSTSSYNNKYNIFAFGSSKITGSIEKFVSGQVSNGRLATTDNPIRSFYANVTEYRVTFGDSTINSVLGETSSAFYITWESESKIALYKGGTIAGSTNIYVRGYSASEITTNQGSGGIWEGKTVTDVVSGTVYPPAN